MPKDAILNIASMTKPLVAVGVRMLYKDGRLLVNGPRLNTQEATSFS